MSNPEDVMLAAEEAVYQYDATAPLDGEDVEFLKEADALATHALEKVEAVTDEAGVIPLESRRQIARIEAMRDHVRLLLGRETKEVT